MSALSEAIARFRRASAGRRCPVGQKMVFGKCRPVRKQR